MASAAYHLSVSDELREKLIENASGPKRVVGDQVSVDQHSLKEQMELDRYLRSSTAMTRNKLPIRLTKLIPPGTV